MDKKSIFNYFSYIIKIIIFIIGIYLYYNGSLTLNRIFIFIIVFLLIYGYSRGPVLMLNIFFHNKVQNYIQNNEKEFKKILYVLLEIYRGINPFIAFLAYTDKGLYKINRYITGTKYIHYNFIVYVLLKYLMMFGLLKLIIQKYYDLGYKLNRLTIVEILFKRMFGLVLSILIFSDIVNNVLGVLSQYSIGIYVIIYYILSILCVTGELFYFYFLGYKLINTHKTIAYLIYLFDNNLQSYTKMNIIVAGRFNYTGLGSFIRHLLKILEISLEKKTNLKESFLSVSKAGEKSYFMGGRIAYYEPLDNYISFKYFDCFGGYIDFELFEPNFELYGECFKSHLYYNSFFKPIREIKYKPSMFLYMQLQELVKLSVSENQPILRLMNGKYFELKYKECYEKFNEEEKIIVNKNLKFLNKVDELRARLMYFTIGDIENHYNYNDGNYGTIQIDIMGEELDFQMNDNVRFANPILSKIIIIANHYMFNNNNELKFYDPEENIEFLNRLFNVLGVLNLDISVKNLLSVEKYYVSKKFINYNKNYVELLKIMYSYDHKRGEEPQCECSYASNYEVEISYKTEEFFYQLRKEWEGSITKEPLEERNGRLLKSLEDLMVKEL